MFPVRVKSRHKELCDHLIPINRMSKCGNKFQWIFYIPYIFENEIIDHMECKRHCAITTQNVLLEIRDISHAFHKWFIMVYRIIIGVILKNFLLLQKHCFFMSRLPRCQHRPQGTDTPNLRKHRSFMSIKSFVQAQHVGQVTGDGVPKLTNLFWFACALTMTQQRYFVHVATAESCELTIAHVRLEKHILIIDRNGHVDLYQLIRLYP